jgi:replicative DNA helicase
MRQHEDSARVPPQSIEAEQSVLGAVLLENKAINQALEILTADDFYRETHREIFRAMMELSDHNQPVDAITLTDALRTKSVLEQIGGPAYIAELADAVPTAANVDHYASIVRRKSILRSIAATAARLNEEAYQADADADNLLERAETEILAIAEKRLQSSFVGSNELVANALCTIEWRMDHRDELTGLSTGLRDLDLVTNGAQPGELWIIAARPSMGKSALVVNIAAQVAYHSLKPMACAFFSMEMSKEEIALRLLAAEARIDLARLRDGFLNQRDLEKLADVTNRIGPKSEIFVDSSSDITPTQLRAKCRRLIGKRKNIGAIFVDYLQLAESLGHKERRDLEVAEISRALKKLAMELQVPVFAVSQLNRNVESRPDKRPVLGDLRESGALEQDADVVIFIYRDEYYTGDKTEAPGIAELIVRKQRNGLSQRTAYARWRGEFMLFENEHAPKAKNAT